MGRILILWWGMAIISGALWVKTLGESNNVIQILNIVMYPFIGVLLGIFLLGILTRRAVSAGALLGAVGGFLVTVSFPTLDPLLRGIGGSDIPNWVLKCTEYMAKVSNFYYGLLGALCTVAFGYLVSLLCEPPAMSKVAGLTRADLPRGNPVPD
ncbi:MAG: hypothetical protein HXY20_15700 [Acidobacteria bacterium]|nr:hypothetical protein [Acidobacteriota bacterium]